jgi:hypothetical protein
MFRESITASVKPAVDLPNTSHHYVKGQRSVESLEEALGRDHRWEIRVGHLACGMDAGVGSPGTDRGDRLSARQVLQGFFDLALNRSLVRLPLPAVKTGSKV